MAGEVKYNERASGLYGIPMNGIAIVQHDTNKLSQAVRGIYCNVAGNVKVTYAGGQDGLAGATFTHAVGATQVLWGLIVQVHDTGTTLADADMFGYL